MKINNLKILVVEDEPCQRHILMRILKNMGLVDIHEAADGQAALDFLTKDKNSPNIIISDLKMPGMDGMELIHQLSQRKKIITLIIISSLEHNLINSIKIMAIAYGIPILGIIDKPVSKDKLDILFQKYLLNYTSNQASERSSEVYEFSKKELLNGLKNEEFEPFFQPKIEMKTGLIKGAESLARWQHPKKGIISPLCFIKQLEYHNLIEDLTWRMLKKIIYYYKIWQKKGLTINTSINISIISLTNSNFANRLAMFINKQGSDPRNITLELTESATTTDIANLLENLSRLRMKGFGLSIDDYGTGYSSMQQITRINFTELKIDQSFVTNVATNELAQVALASSLDIAKRLKLISVAEGVETLEDWNYLLALGCDIAQGYFIARPMPADLFYKWAMEWIKNPTLKGS